MICRVVDTNHLIKRYSHPFTVRFMEHCFSYNKIKKNVRGVYEMLYHSKNSRKKVVHSSSCFHASRIKEGNIATFKNLNDAHKCGYKLCRHCEASGHSDPPGIPPRPYSGWAEKLGIATAAPPGNDVEFIVLSSRFFFPHPPVECEELSVESFHPLFPLHNPCGKVIIFPTPRVDKKSLAL